jgi:hypothetical protein
LPTQYKRIITALMYASQYLCLISVLALWRNTAHHIPIVNTKEIIPDINKVALRCWVSLLNDLLHYQLLLYIHLRIDEQLRMHQLLQLQLKTTP